MLREVSTQEDTQTNETDVVTTVRLPRDVHARLREIAAAEHRTFSGEMRRLAELRIAEIDSMGAAA